VGIREIGSVRGTDDLAELGGNQPDLRVAAAIHPDSAHIGVTRTNGITRSETAPQGGGPMMGQSAVIKLAGDTWEDMLTQDRSLLHVRFPRVANNAKEKQEPPAVKELSKLLAEAREYERIAELARAGKCAAPLFDPRLDSLVPYALGEKPVALHADNAQTILYALRFAKKEKLDAILYGVSEGWKVAEAIARERVPVVVGPVLGLPASEFDPYDACYANAAVLQRAGVPFAIMSDDVENPRNVAFHAATAAAYGLPREEAVRAITYYAARTLGLEAELGSLAPGKIGDVIIMTGDLLSTTAEVTHVLIDGVPTSMENRQSQLYQRYRERLHRLQGKPK
jgi:imidazolonepropionase-like amidohydrolase